MVYDVDEAGATRWDVTLKDVSRAPHPLNLQVSKAFCGLSTCTAQLSKRQQQGARLGTPRQCVAGNLPDHAAQSQPTTEACF